MNYLQLQNHLTGPLLGERSDVSGEKAQRALEAAHLAIQRDELSDPRTGERLDPEWEAMLQHPTSTYTYTAGSAGIALATIHAALKRLTDIWIVDSDGYEIPVEPATRDQVQDFARYEYREYKNRTVPSGQYHQRWYVDANTLKLLYPPDTGDDDVTVKARFYARLPFYTADTDEDWFSTSLWDVLTLGAAAYGSTYLWEDERGAGFMAQYQRLVVAALRQDKKNRVAGMRRVYRPPLAGTSKF